MEPLPSDEVLNKVRDMVYDEKLLEIVRKQKTNNVSLNMMNITWEDTCRS